MIIKKEKIGNGSHWDVFRITKLENGKEKSVLHKESRKGACHVDKNVDNHSIISSCGLPTLNKFRKINELTIEVEDLNQNPKDGYFVSPNTMRSCPSCATVFLKFLEDKEKQIEKFEAEQCKDFSFQDLLNNCSTENIDELKNKLIVQSIAESKLYESKVNEIANLETFISDAILDMRKAAEANIELFFDAFFFRVKSDTNEIEYKIADFDCIIYHKTNESVEDLRKANKEYFKTALIEYIVYFVADDKKNDYTECVNSY